MTRQVLTVLYLVGPEMEPEARAEMERAGGLPRRGALGRDWMVVAHGGVTHQLRLVTDVEQAIRILGEQYFNFLVVDNRIPAGLRPRNDCFAESLARNLMARVHYSADPERMYPLARILAVLDMDECLASQAFALGQLKIGGFVINPFDGSLFELMAGIQAQSGPGKSSLCLSGGGVEGFLFELGVLKALNAHLQNASVTDFNIYCGISAGALLAAFVANGVEPEDLAAGMNGESGGTSVAPLRPGMIFKPDVRELARRLRGLAGILPMTSWTDTVSRLIKAVPAGFFSGDHLRRYVEEQLGRNGRTNDFRRLPNELYIGATDQDTSSHVIFGHGQWRDVPIADAVRASTALTPFFEPHRIRGRYFVDGQYTRTSNFHFAVEQGARLVVVVDPLLPVRAEQPGYVRAKGGVFSALQALKAVIHTRFMHAIQHAAESYPEVDFVLFKPEADDMRLMSGSPMKYTFRTEIVNMAYRCTVRKIQRDFEILAGTFGKHGFRLQRNPRLRAQHRAVI